VRNQLRAEFLKQRTTRTTVGMAAAMLGLVVLAIALHALGLPAKDLTSRSDQLGVMVDVGENLGALFAGLLGAMSITAEVRYGTIRPTFLVSPRRSRVVLAKSMTSMATGLVFGLLSTAVAAGAGATFLASRGLAVHVTAGNYALLIAGGAASAALWAVIGLGIGAIVRSQVPTVVGILVWLLFVENTVATGVPSIAKFAPGTLGQAVAGKTRGTLHTPAIGALLLGLYAVTALTAGRLATTRRDFA
jgi:ABC-type transport system involved in multi-copper enzyme maturation permease subunit